MTRPEQSVVSFDPTTGAQASLWGIESDAEDYLVEVAQELVEELAA